MKIGVSIFILLFLLIQSYFPISFYYRFYFEKEILESNINNIDKREPETIRFSELNLKKHDERFSWRMFSPTAIDTKCKIDYYNSKTFKQINYNLLYSKQWIDLMEMCRQPIIEEISKDLCLKNKEKNQQPQQQQQQQQQPIFLIIRKHYQNDLILEKRINLVC
ncbi:hypothetical protein ACTFIY_008111 [Dictyostelium cf. discoideum]